MVEEMLHDGREIRVLRLPGGGGRGWAVGRDSVDKIEVYGEPGHGVMAPWFALWSGGKIWARVNAAMVESVGYVRGG